MTLRRVLLLVMLVALAGCALLAMAALFVPFAETVWRLAGTAFNTGIACALLMPLSLLVDRPKLRLGGLAGMVLVTFCWIMAMVMLWSTGLGFGESLAWRAFLLFWQALLVGVPATAALMMISLPWARIAAWTFVSVAALAFAFFFLGSLLPENTSSFLPFSDLAGKLWFTGWLVESIGAVVAALLVNLGCGDRRYFRWAGVLCCIVGFAIGAVGVWIDPPESGVLGRVMAISIITGVVLGHINLLLMARLLPWQRFIQWGTMALVLVSGLSAVFAALFVEERNVDESLLVRLAAAGAIAAGCGSLALIILSLFNRNPQKAPGVVTEFKEIAIICPSCQTRQRVPLGEAACKTCSLKILIKVVEPRCPGCGYLLYRNTSTRCPECGLSLGASSENTPPVVSNT